MFDYVSWKITSATVYPLSITIKRKNPSELQAVAPKEQLRAAAPAIPTSCLNQKLAFSLFFPFLNLNLFNSEFLLTTPSQFFLSQTHNENTASGTLPRSSLHVAVKWASSFPGLGINPQFLS